MQCCLRTCSAVSCFCTQGSPVISGCFLQALSHSSTTCPTIDPITSVTSTADTKDSNTEASQESKVQAASSSPKSIVESVSVFTEKPVVTVNDKEVHVPRVCSTVFLCTRSLTLRTLASHRAAVYAVHNGITHSAVAAHMSAWPAAVQDCNHILKCSSVVLYLVCLTPLDSIKNLSHTEHLLLRTSVVSMSPAILTSTAYGGPLRALSSGTCSFPA